MEFEGVSPRTPIIIVSAEALAEHREAALAAGADHYVAKPFTPESLLEAMDIVLSSADPVIEL
jgi:two-component system, sensor histidine kinase